MNEQSESGIFHKNDFDITTPYNGEQACFAFDRSDLFQDTLTYAIKQGITPEAAKKFLGNVNFVTSTWKEYLSSRKKMRLWQKLLINLDKNNDPVAFVDPKSEEGKVDFFINFEKIAELVSRGVGMGSFKGPKLKSVSSEAAQATLTRAVDSIYTHERQHIIELMQPKKAKLMEKDMNMMKTGNIIASTLLFVSTSGILFSQILPEGIQTLTNIVLGGVGYRPLLG